MTRRLSRVARVRPHAAIANAADADAPRIALQPIIATSTGSILAVEALARFADRANTEAVLRTALRYYEAYPEEIDERVERNGRP